MYPFLNWQWFNIECDVEGLDDEHFYVKSALNTRQTYLRADST